MNDVTIIRKYKLIAKLREAFVPSQRDRTFHGTDRVATDNNCMVCFRCFGVSSASMSPCSCQTTIVVVWVNVATGADCLLKIFRVLYSTSRNWCNHYTLRLTSLPLMPRCTSLHLEFFW